MRVSRLAVCCSILAVAPLVPVTTLAEEVPLSASIAGERYGLAMAASSYCPAGIITDKGKALGERFEGADAEAFKAQAEKVLEAWRTGSDCDEDKMDRYQLGMCRTMRLKNCRAVWTQLGPDGSVMPGLVDTDYSKVD